MKTLKLVMLVLGLACAVSLARVEAPASALAANPSTQPAGLTDLSDDAREIKAAFNQAAGHVRLILFVSPT